MTDYIPDWAIIPPSGHNNINVKPRPQVVSDAPRGSQRRPRR